MVASIVVLIVPTVIRGSTHRVRSFRGQNNTRFDKRAKVIQHMVIRFKAILQEIAMSESIVGSAVFDSCLMSTVNGDPSGKGSVNSQRINVTGIGIPASSSDIALK